MKEILKKGLKFTFVVGTALFLYSLFEKTNYNEWLRICLCVFSAHWISCAIVQIYEEVKENEKRKNK